MMNRRYWACEDNSNEFNWSSNYEPIDFPVDLNDISELNQHNSFSLDREVINARHLNTNKLEITTSDGIDNSESQISKSQQLIIPDLDLFSHPLTPQEEEESSVDLTLAKFRRPIRQIQISKDALQDRIKIAKGEPSQTKNLCRHMHTETVKFLRNLVKFHILQEENAKMAREFSESNSSIETFKTIFKNNIISSHCREHFESRSFLQKIITSQMNFKTKISIIKYLERIRSLTYNPTITKWKKNS